MNSLRPESHVAQQIRRDKLRIQNGSQHLQEFPINLEHLSSQPGFNMDLLQVRNVRNANMLDEPTVYASEMLNFSTASNPLSAPRNALEYQELGVAEPRLMMHPYGSFPHSLASLHSSQREQSELRNLENWRNGNPHDWVVSYANSSLANRSNTTNSFIDAYQHYGKPNYHGQFGNAYGEIAGRETHKQLGVIQLPPPSPVYQNALQDIVKSASISAHGSDVASLIQQTGQGIWVGGASEVEIQPCYGNQPNQLRYGWTNRPVDNNTLRWSSSLSFTDKKDAENPGTLLNDSNPESLSLSLSSNTQSKACVSHFEEGTASDDLQSGCGISKYPQSSKYMESVMKPSIVSRDCGKSLQDTAGIALKTSYRNVGPLGPFTGYATILKSSRFLETAQQLLDEFCSISGPKFAKSSDEVSASTSADTVAVNETGVASKGNNNSGSSSSKFYISNENSVDWEARSSFGLSSRPGYQQKKAKLLYMQQEVSRRYKQYHQQMQMVVSSFESVAGLSSATPYISLSLKSVSKHFRFLNNSISDQIKLINEVLGEDLTVPTSTSSKVDTNMARLRCMDHSFHKNKSGRGLEPQQHVWRPQRGLPERSVAILRAWLFEHFLHPYPTDADKHMLATQTGLSRNQVSNWFINARVRVWKPMVEEIHMLETRTTVANENSNKNEGASGSERSTGQPRVDKHPSKFGMLHTIPENQFQGMEEMGSSNVVEKWSQEKRSKLESQMTSNMDGTLLSLLPRRHGGLDVGGIGSVSLTLGLRHGVEGVQHQQQQLQEEQLRHHLGGQMIHDFVG